MAGKKGPSDGSVAILIEDDAVVSWRFTDLRFSMRSDKTVATVEVTYYRRSGAPFDVDIVGIEGEEYENLLVAINTPLPEEEVGDPLDTIFRRRVAYWLVQSGRFRNIAWSPPPLEPEDPEPVG
jgi:hypothetical protein